MYYNIIEIGLLTDSLYCESWASTAFDTEFWQL